MEISGEAIEIKPPSPEELAGIEDDDEFFRALDRWFGWTDEDAAELLRVNIEAFGEQERIEAELGDPDGEFGGQEEKF